MPTKFALCAHCRKASTHKNVTRESRLRNRRCPHCGHMIGRGRNAAFRKMVRRDARAAEGTDPTPKPSSPEVNGAGGSVISQRVAAIARSWSR